MTEQRTPKVRGRFCLVFQVSCANPSHMLARKMVYARWPISEEVSNKPKAAFATATPVPPARPSVNRNWPFWLFVQVGQADTLISSLSFSPERSNRPPNLSVWFPLIHEKLSDMS